MESFGTRSLVVPLGEIRTSRWESTKGGGRMPKEYSRSYLREFNIEVADAELNEFANASAVRFHNMHLMAVTLPRMKFRWPRNLKSIECASIMLAQPGGIEISGPDTVYRYAPNFYYVPPGSNTLEITTLSSKNTVFVITGNISLLSDMSIRSPILAPGSWIDQTQLEPLLVFVRSLLSLPKPPDPRVPALRAATREVIRSIFSLPLVACPEQGSLYARSMEMIATNYACAELTTARLAEELSVSPRTLQKAFRERGISCNAAIREVRAQVAAGLLEERGSKTLEQIAAQVGFGSVTTMRRALREFC